MVLRFSFFLLLSLSLAFASVPVEKMIGQMVMVGFKEGALEQNKPLQEAIKAGEIGGVLLLGRNIQSPSQLKTLTTALQDHAKIPLLISVDQEGGRVARLGANNGFSQIPSAREVATTLSLGEARALYFEMAKVLKAHGINYNLGPVVDFDNPAAPIIGKIGRSYSSHASVVSLYAGAFVDAHHEAGVLSALKHFPGHGSALVDSHHALTDITATWDVEELRPYYEFIGAQKAQSIMVAHVYLRQFDNTFPASLSSKILKGVLRDTLGFKGVVISDDLLMEGVATTFSFEERIIHSVNAGVDIVLVSECVVENKQTPAYIQAVLLNALQTGAVELKTIEKAYERIMRFKQALLQ